MAIDTEKGFHMGTLMSVLIATVAYSLYNNLLLPCLPFLIKFYYPDVDISNVSYYSGFLLSAYYLGQIPGCIFWGWYADQRGRKEAMIIITTFNFICTFFLGLSNNYYLSIAIRAIQGFTDGALGIDKIIVAELSNERNIALGTSFLFVATAIGRFFGPLFGRLCTDKTMIQPLIQWFPILNERLFLLPFLTCSVMYFIALLSFIFFAQDTITQEEIQAAKTYKAQMKRDLSTLFRKNALEGYNSREQLLLQYNKYSSFSSLLKDRDIFLSIFLYFITTLIQMTFDTIIPSIWVNKLQFGGFEMDLNEVSNIQLMASPIAMATTLINPIWSHYTTYKKQMLICMYILAGIMFFYPIESLFNTSNTIIQFAITTVFYSAYNLIRSISFNITFVIIANVAYKEFRGSIMGTAQTIGGLGRFVGPTVFASVYAWSCHKPHFPIHHGLTFYILGIFALINVLFVTLLSETCNKSRGSIMSTIVHSKK